MVEQVAAKKKRQRRVPSAAVLKITVERSELVTKSRRVWQQNVNPDGTAGYVDDVWPQESKLVLIEQSLPESKFDLAKVIKAINGL